MTDDIDIVLKTAAEQSVEMLLEHIDLQILMAEAGITLPGKSIEQKSGINKSIYNLRFLRQWVLTTLQTSKDPVYIAGICGLMNTTMYAVAKIGREIDKKTMDRLRLSEQLETVRSKSMKAKQKAVIDTTVPALLREYLSKGHALNGTTNAIATRILPDVNRKLVENGLSTLRGASAVRERVDKFRAQNGLT